MTTATVARVALAAVCAAALVGVSGARHEQHAETSSLSQLLSSVPSVSGDGSGSVTQTLLTYVVMDHMLSVVEASVSKVTSGALDQGTLADLYEDLFAEDFVGRFEMSYGTTDIAGFDALVSYVYNTGVSVSYVRRYFLNREINPFSLQILHTIENMNVYQGSQTRFLGQCAMQFAVREDDGRLVITEWVIKEEDQAPFIDGWLDAVCVTPSFD